MFQLFRPIFVIVLGGVFFITSYVFADDYIKKPAVDASYNVVVIGDSLGAGLWQGLHQNFRDKQEPAVPTVNVVRETKTNTGLVRSDRYDWPRQVERLAKKPDFQIAVMMFGANDAQSIRLQGKRHHFKTEGWEMHYRQRIDRMINALKKKDVAIYWVGLPNVQNPDRRKEYLYVNAIFKKRALENGVRFIDTWDVTNDEKGHFRPYGTAIDGTKSLLRAKDGTHFTAAGYRILAQYAEEVMRQDLDISYRAINARLLKKSAH